MGHSARFPMTRYRIYFNSHADWPEVWSVDQGDPRTEVICERVRIVKRAIPLPTQRAIVETQSTTRWREPRAWIEVRGHKHTIRRGTFTIYC